MDELVHHCLREIAFDGDLGMSLAAPVETVDICVTRFRRSPLKGFYCGFLRTCISPPGSQ